MATGTLRVVLVVVGLVLGIFVLAKAFPEGGAAVSVEDQTVSTDGDEGTNGTTTGETGQPGDGGGTQEGGGEDVSLADLRLQVLNGAGETGLAADTKEFLESLGYRNIEVADAASPADTTTIHFSSGFRDEAQQLREELYPDAELVGGVAGDVPVDITVILGSDYVEAN